MNKVTQKDLERVMKCEPLFVIGEEEISFVDLYHTKEDRDIAESFLAVTVDTWKDADNAYNATQPQVNDSLAAVGIYEIPDDDKEFDKNFKVIFCEAHKNHVEAIIAAGEEEAKAYKHREWATQRVAAATRSYHFWCDMIKKVEAELAKRS